MARIGPLVVWDNWVAVRRFPCAAWASKLYDASNRPSHTIHPVLPRRLLFTKARIQGVAAGDSGGLSTSIESKPLRHGVPIEPLVEPPPTFSALASIRKRPSYPGDPIRWWCGFVAGAFLGVNFFAAAPAQGAKMIRLQTYAAFSLLATASAVYYAFSSREQFYPAMVYLSTSKICFVLLLNTGLVAMCVAWQLVKRIFLGSLREAEVERLNEQSWREVVEILFAVTIFRQDFSVSFLAMVAALLLVKALHWLAHKRVEYIETTPSVPMLSHIRIVSFMAFLLIVDCLFLSNSLRPLIQKREASVAIFFSFEYMILATSTVSTFVKYVLYVSDMLMEGQWEKKAVYTFYLELISDLVHLSLYMLFFIAIFLNYGVPLHLIRELYETFRNFRIRIADYVRYRKITSNMNERFPDASAEELNASDATCIICREEMTTAKKLLCGHLFHVHCLRSWLERQHTCPTCRAPIVPPDNGRAASARQHGAQPGAQLAAGTTPNSEGAPGENMSRRQAKLEAAAAAASLYGRSFVYPPANTLNRSVPPQSTSTPQSEASSSNQSQKDQELQFQNTSNGLAPLPFNAHGAIGSETSTRDLKNSLQKAQENFIKSQIEMLQIQLQMVQRGAAALATNNENAEHTKND